MMIFLIVTAVFFWLVFGGWIALGFVAVSLGATISKVFLLLLGVVLLVKLGTWVFTKH